jgi:hypothetical protein
MIAWTSSPLVPLMITGTGNNSLVVEEVDMEDIVYLLGRAD